MLTGSKGTMPERCSMMQQFPRIWASHGITWGHITAINGQCKAKEKKQTEANRSLPWTVSKPGLWNGFWSKCNPAQSDAASLTWCMTTCFETRHEHNVSKRSIFLADREIARKCPYATWLCKGYCLSTWLCKVVRWTKLERPSHELLLWSASMKTWSTRVSKESQHPLTQSAPWNMWEHCQHCYEFLWI